MARRIAISRIFEQPSVLTRSGTGLATSFSPVKKINAPAVYKYGLGYEVKEHFPTKSWCLVIQDEDTLVDPSALSDPDIKLLPVGWTMTTVLTAGQRNAANAALVGTDIGVTVVTGQTVKSMVAAILTALGHSPQAEEWIFL